MTFLGTKRLCFWFWDVKNTQRKIPKQKAFIQLFRKKYCRRILIKLQPLMKLDSINKFTSSFVWRVSIYTDVCQDTISHGWIFLRRGIVKKTRIVYFQCCIFEKGDHKISGFGSACSKFVFIGRNPPFSPVDFLQGIVSQVPKNNYPCTIMSTFKS